jgi:hypothetical protein
VHREAVPEEMQIRIGTVSLGLLSKSAKISVKIAKLKEPHRSLLKFV